MNERIRELTVSSLIIKQLTHLAFNEVRTTVDINDPAWKELVSIIVKDNKVLSVFKEKFAELIVRECIDAIDAKEYVMGGDAEANGMRFAISIIKNHFGVKE